MKATILLSTAVLAAILLTACAKVTQENFSRIERGMSEREVISILGSPTESSSVDVLGVSGTAARWVGGNAEITVRFVGGKVALKSFDKPAVK